MLSDSLRPQNLSEFLGQEHLVGQGKVIRRMIEEDAITSIILWGPPGSGKTTLARIIAKATKSDFFHFSAVTSNLAEVRKIIEQAKVNKQKGIRTILFIDEIHRFNKLQQDAFLPHIENGTIILIGATTENPSFEVNNALLSRSRVYVLYGLSEDELALLIKRALTDKEKGLGTYKIDLPNNAKNFLINASGADARVLLNALETSVITTKPDKKGVRVITKEILESTLQKKSLLYDKSEEEHYNTISAFIKSMRGSDPDAALYYLFRMIEAGEDPLFIARRMVIFASEDVGLADARALILANSCFEAVHKVGMPEAQLLLAHTVFYLAVTQKSRSIPNAIGRVRKAVYETLNEPIPLHLRNAPTKLMKELGYAKGYHWEENVYLDKQLSFLPEKLKGKKFLKKE